MIWLLFLIPVVIAILFVIYHRKTHEPMETLKITAILTVGSVALQSLLYVTLTLGKAADVELLNGYVTGKERDVVSCSHSYECMCYYTESCSGSGTSRSCTRTRHCSTCYEHSYDVDWDVHTTVGNLTIDRIDRQGLDQPPRWTAVQP